MDHLTNHPGVLISFGIAVLIMLLLDLGIFKSDNHEVSLKEASVWTIIWVSLAMIFSGVLYYYTSFEDFAKFQSAYWIEKALSIDNIFVFILIFKYLDIPSLYHKKILLWGVLGAVFFRAVFIFAGVELINLTYLPEIQFLGKNIQVNVLLTIFGFILLYSGYKSWFKREKESNSLTESGIITIIYKYFRVSEDYHGDRFFIRKNGVFYMSYLFVALMVIEISDLIFAIDSIPAIFAIAPDNPLVLYTSNIFAILGLRSIYFLLSNIMDKFSKLQYGLGIILSFIGFKMLLAPFYHISSTVSLIVIALVLLGTILWSVLSAKNKEN